MTEKHWLSPENALAWLFTIGSLEGLGAVVWTAAIPRDPKNGILFGFSLDRLLLIGLMFIGAVALGWLARAAHQHRGRMHFLLQHLTKTGLPRLRLPWLVGILFVIWIIFFLPPDRLGTFNAYWVRLHPLRVWLSLLSIQGLFFISWLSRRSESNQQNAPLRQNRLLVLSAAIALLSFLGIWLFMGWTRVGVTPDDRFWNEAGVPLLPFQILFACAISLIIADWLFKNSNTAKNRLIVHFDLWMALLIWLAASLAWNLAPFERSYFAPAPVAPNNVYYPYSDAEYHDAGAQYLLIGRGINNLEYTDKPLYMLFLAFLHMLEGQDTLRLAGSQAIFLALLPAIVYLIGVSFRQRGAGFLAGLLILFKEYNAIAAVLKIQVAHSRLFMSELPTALGIAFLALVMMEWLRKPEGQSKLALLTGGGLGLLMLVRTTPLFFVPVVIFWSLIIPTWKKRLQTVTFLVVGILLAIAPWFLGGRTADGRAFIEAKIDAVISTRYVSGEDTPKPVDSQPPQGETAPRFTDTLGKAREILGFVSSHFFHNLAMEVLSFPLTPALEDLTSTLKASYWNNHWDGELRLGQVVFLSINLAILALGVGIGFQEDRWLGLFPLTLFFVYHLANGLGRTSGARYLVPVDWVIVFYFALGLFHLAGWFVSIWGIRFQIHTESLMVTSRRGSRGSSWWLMVLMGITIAGIGSSLFWVGALFPQRYLKASASEVLESVMTTLNAAGVQSETARQFLEEPGMVILRGRGLYPKFFQAGHGELCPQGKRELLEDGYPHFMLRVIGSQRSCVRLPLHEMKEPFPDAADVVVIGCEIQNNEIQALAIVVDEPLQKVLLRDPAAEWRCPLPVPVCREDGRCR